MSAPLCTVTPLEALRRLYDVARKVDASESGEFDTALQGELAVVEAVLRVASAPVSEIRSDLTVWYGSMSESNGKSNFTATLMRKGATAFDTNQFTFARSEYPDRVRYDADCMRYLIGEINTQPCILDYDADKHSGYAAPVVPVAAQPVATVIKNGAERTWMSENLGSLPDGQYSLYLNAPSAASVTDVAKDADSDDQLRGEGWLKAMEQVSALLPGPYYMDLPDGGSVTVLEQLQRMAKDAARWRWLHGSSRGQFTHPIVVEQLRNPLWDHIQYIGPLSGPALDTAIDAAIAAQQGEKT